MTTRTSALNGGTEVAATPQQPVQVRETHCAVVLLMGDRAYKVKKSVDLGFLDFSSREARQRACREEVRLYRRMAPDVYLGVLDVLDPSGRPCEHVVAMRRMPDDVRLSTLVEQDREVGPALRLLARDLAAFHARAETSPTISAAGTAEALTSRWRSNVDGIRALGLPAPDDRVIDGVEQLAMRYVEGRGPLLEERIRAGMIRDGHGDLLADDVFCLPDGPRALDCLEFDDRLRWMDVLDDVCCLAMDLERLGRADLGQQLLGDYAEFSGDAQPASLAHHYIAYRAFMRAKIAALRASGARADDAVRNLALSQAARLASIAMDHLERARVRLVVVGGPPASGKSTVARGIGQAMEAAVLSSDRIRKETLGLDPSTHAPAAVGQGAYSPEATRRTYEALGRLASTMLTRGHSVVVDATCTLGWQRQLLRDVADRASADVDELQCVADPMLRRDRLRQRVSKPDRLSDADERVGDVLGLATEPWPTAATVDTSLSPQDSVHQALDELALPGA